MSFGGEDEEGICNMKVSHGDTCGMFIELLWGIFKGMNEDGCGWKQYKQSDTDSLEVSHLHF